MEQEEKPKRPPPPASGRWAPGQSGNPAGRPKRKIFTESLHRVLAAISPADDGAGAIDKLMAAQYAKAMNGDTQAFIQLRDMAQGKLPNVVSVGGSDELPAIKAIQWLDVLQPPDEPKIIEHVPEQPALEGSTSVLAGQPAEGMDAAQRDDERTEEPKDTDPS